MSKYRILPALLLLLCIVLVAFAPYKGGKKWTGALHLKSGVVDLVKGEQPCRVDSSDGFVLELGKEVENPLFQSEEKNKVRLLLGFNGELEIGKRYYVPSESVNAVCYREEGDLLMFESFKGSGWVEFGGKGKRGKVKGNVDLRLVEPHHNFSNSDFHYVGGIFEVPVKE